MRIDALPVIAAAARPLARLCLGLCLGACTLAAAQSSPWYVGGSVALTHDANLYKISDGAPALPGGLSKGDNITTLTAMAGFDQTIGRQRVRGDVSLRDIRFATNTALANQGYALKLGADWTSIERLSGSVNLVADRSLVRFNNDSIVANNLERNISTTRSFDSTVRLGVVTRWTVEGSYAHQSADYSAPAYAPREYRQDSVSAGMRYSPNGIVSLALAARETRGRYPRFARTLDGQFVADRYRGSNLDLSARWVPSTISQIDARLSLGRTRFDRATGSDFSGLTGSATWTWHPTGKLRFETRLARDRGQDAQALDYFASGRFADVSRTTTSLLIGATYELSSKINLTVGAAHSTRDLVDTRTGFFGDVSTLSGADRTRMFALGVRWTPTRSLALGCDANWERRSANSSLSSDYSASTLGCFGQITLQ